MEKANQIKEELKVIFADVDSTLGTIANKEEEKTIANLFAWENLKSEIMSQDDKTLISNFKSILVFAEEQKCFDDGAKNEYIRKEKTAVVRSYAQDNKIKIARIVKHSYKILFPAM